ncbi:MAG: hypothetical protein K0R39_4115 [Symbiobacteriaceae bacterium]|jgi:hypothetical protein|nr:hypothetical protein [Symbiobacteriaceae bacterium]
MMHFVRITINGANCPKCLTGALLGGYASIRLRVSPANFSRIAEFVPASLLASTPYRLKEEVFHGC